MTDIKRHHVPRWLYRRLQKTTELPKNRRGAELLQFDKDVSTHWLDHWGSVDNIFFSEPYDISQEDIARIINFAQRHDLEFRFSGDAAWHDKALRVLFCPVAHTGE